MTKCQARPDRGGPIDPRQTNPTRVLIIDDHLATSDTYSTVLRLAGFATATAATGLEGLAQALAQVFDVILVDLQLPDCSGLEVVRQLRRDGNSAKVVIVTAFPTLESAFDAPTAGAEGYVDGPLFGEEIVELVRRALSGPYPVRHPKTVPMVERDDERRAAPVVDARVREAMRLIDADLARAWSVDQLAGQVALSESRLRYLFALVGQTVTHYVRERRLQELARQLTVSNANVRQIAYSIGFRSESLGDVRRAFRQRYGMSPIAYRSRHTRLS